MKDQNSTSDEGKEPARNRTIPDDFIWDPELQGWYAPGEPSPTEVFRARLREIENNRDVNERVGLISVDELRAAGALSVPAARRKSLGVKREHYPLFPDDDDDDPSENE